MTTPADEPRSGDAPGKGQPVDETKLDQGAGAEDELPEYEPLTPELVEEEAIRGDFVLRWSIILLAFLLGCTQIAETETLVHIKTGQYLASHGILPPRVDVFSNTASGRPWVNLAWGFDLLLAGVYGVGGAVGLTLFKATLAALTFWFLMNTVKRNVATWWASICGALALLAAYRQFTALPEIITLVGLAAVIWLIHRWREGGSTTNLWALVPTFVVWANLDQRMFLGLAYIVLYAVGYTLGAKRSSDGARAEFKPLWTAVGVSAVATLFNPFGYHALLAPVRLYLTDYPAFRLYLGEAPGQADVGYYPMAHTGFWNMLDHSGVAALLLLAAGVVTMGLNRKRLDLGQALAFCGFAVFGALATRELAPAAIVFCAIATLNAQEWYRATFRQTYSIELSERMFSLGGRVITVLGLFVFAWLFLSGRLDGPEGLRTGVGLDHDLAVDVESLGDAVADSFDDRPFNFRAEQGDVLIWLDRKPFIDGRIPLYAGAGNDDLITTHNAARRALRSARGETESAAAARQDVWRKIFDRFQVTHVLPRLGGDTPDYVTYGSLLRNLNWQLTELAAAAAVFHRKDVQQPELQAYLAQHPMTFKADAFEKSEPAAEPAAEPAEPKAAPATGAPAEEEPTVAQSFQRLDWAQPPSTFPVLPRNERENEVQLASHYLKNLESLRQDADFGTLTSIAYLAIRNANRGLAKNSQDHVGYAVLGDAYYFLEQVEANVAQQQNGAAPSIRRYYQALQALHQALVIRPDISTVHRNLALIHVAHGRADLALREINEFERSLPPDDTSGLDPVGRQLISMRRQLEPLIENAEKQIATQLSQQQNPIAVAQRAVAEFGCALHALEIIENNDNLIRGNPQLQQLHIQLLIEGGQPQRAAEAAAQLQGVVEQTSYHAWRNPVAFAYLGNADYESALQIWTKGADEIEKLRIGPVLSTLPLEGPASSWPLAHASAAVSSLFTLPHDQSEMLLYAALTRLETGENAEAEKQFRDTLASNPETPYRALIAAYLEALSGEKVDPLPPSEQIPVDDSPFAAEPLPGEESATTERTTAEPTPMESTPTEPAAAESSPAAAAVTGADGSVEAPLPKQPASEPAADPS